MSKSVAEKARADLAERNRVLGVFLDEDSRVLDNEVDRALGRTAEAPRRDGDAERAGQCQKGSEPSGEAT